MRICRLLIVLALLLTSGGLAAGDDELGALKDRVIRLEAENAQLKADLLKVRAENERLHRLCEKAGVNWRDETKRATESKAGAIGADRLHEVLPAEPDNYRRNIELAYQYAQGVQRFSGFPEIGDNKGSVGYFTWGPRDEVAVARIVQVLEDGRLLLRAGRENFFLSRVSTADLTDDSLIMVGHLLVVCDGTESYTAVTGAQTTVRAYSTVEPADLARAAEYRLHQLEAYIASLKNSHAGQVSAARKELQVWSAMAGTNEVAAQKAASTTKHLEELGPATREEVALLQDKLAEAEADLVAQKQMIGLLKFKGR